jgi:ATP-dependent DNA helicase RecG
MSEILDIQERISLAIRIGESHYREFKSAFEGPSSAKKPRDPKAIMVDVARTLVAFANADGGELLVGVEDDGTITGVPHDADVVAGILSADANHVHSDTPLPAPRKRSVTFDGHTVVYFSVSKGNRYIHLTADGRCLRRMDRETLPYSSEGIAASRLEDQSRTWDREPAHGATLDDLDLDLVQNVAAQVAYGISVEKCLQYLDLAEFTPDGMRLKRAAALLFAKDVRRWHPGCFVRLMTVQGKEKRSGEGYNIRKDEVVAGNILRLVDSSWERLTHALSTQTQLTESARFQTTLMFPQSAVREALMNGIVHRNYAIEGRGIEITIYQDRLEVLSPGMLLSTISLEDIRNLKGVHESRNPLVARVLREVGFIREMGEGMRRIFNVMRSSALAEPEIDSDTSGFNVTLYHKSLYDPSVKLWLTTFDRHKLTENQTAVLALGYGGKEFSTQDVIDRLGIIDIDQLQETITPLRKLGLLQRTKTHAMAYKYAEKHRVPKREVPTYRVLEATAANPEPPVSEIDAQIEEVTTLHKLFIANIPYEMTKADVVAFLSPLCDVRSVSLPSGKLWYNSPSRGFAFATVDYAGSTDSLVSKLDGTSLHGRRLHVSRYRDPGAP